MIVLPFEWNVSCASIVVSRRKRGLDAAIRKPQEGRRRFRRHDVRQSQETAA